MGARRRVGRSAGLQQETATSTIQRFAVQAWNQGPTLAPNASAAAGSRVAATRSHAAPSGSPAASASSSASASGAISSYWMVRSRR